MLGRRLFILGGVLLGSASLGSAGVYFQENFDSLGVGLYDVGSNPAVGGFTLTGGSIDLMGTGYFAGLCVGATVNNCVDLSGNSPSTLVSNSFDLPAGSFALSFVLNGTGPTRPLPAPNLAEATVSLSSNGNPAFWTNIYTYTNTDLDSVVEQFFLVAPLTNVQITIAEANPPLVTSADPVMDGNIVKTGLILDTVSLQDAPLPEPSTLLGGLLGAAVIWSARRRGRG